MNVRGSWYFPWPVKSAGAVILTVIALTKLLSMPLLAFVLLILAAILLTAHYGVRIDLSRKTYKEYVWILGWKNGKKVAFKTIEYLFVKSAKVTRGYNTKVQHTSFTNVEYDGYLKISEDTKIHLINAATRQQVIKRLAPLKNYLNTKLVDYTGEMPEEI